MLTSGFKIPKLGSGGRKIRLHALNPFRTIKLSSTTGRALIDRQKVQDPFPQQNTHHGRRKDHVCHLLNQILSSNKLTKKPTENSSRNRATSSRTPSAPLQIPSPPTRRATNTRAQRIRDRPTRRARIHLRPSLHPPNRRPITHPSPDLLPKQSQAASPRKGLR